LLLLSVTSPPLLQALVFLILSNDAVDMASIARIIFGAAFDNAGRFTTLRMP
jgi:hypothetical protein